VNWSAETIGEFPDVVSTWISTVPVASAGETAVMEVTEFTVNCDRGLRGEHYGRHSGEIRTDQVHGHAAILAPGIGGDGGDGRDQELPDCERLSGGRENLRLQPVAAETASRATGLGATHHLIRPAPVDEL
jgi:hypothetical protein